MPNTFHRSDRISAELRRLVGTLVHEVVRDNALPSVSVSDVEASRELDVATVYITALLAEQGPPAVKLLNEMAKDFRRELSRIMKIRRVPELRFKYDDSVDKGERIEQLLRDAPRPASREPDAE
ncbi:30S ribosome-binding factor RbfA [Tahibacter harae]|uniref:Ribosome-binding factor A n=1 Tax=Tahibacter harae TaxID=2963937 RepID=A0ABT1QKV1_9GAMM|nr:30S ribosome-binding factor RbfA [Tahibacter harae]MCQ4163146.1 30S ribosome-binding factor RbfA [Tahibacter harae]